MANKDAERLMKLSRALSVKFHGKDHHGDTVFVEIEGPAAQQILDYLHAGIVSSGGVGDKLILRKPQDS